MIGPFRARLGSCLARAREWQKTRKSSRWASWTFLTPRQLCAEHSLVSKLRAFGSPFSFTSRNAVGAGQIAAGCQRGMVQETPSLGTLCLISAVAQANAGQPPSDVDGLNRFRNSAMVRLFY